MPNTTTPASVASLLTDEQIESIAESLEHDAENLYGDNTRLFMEDERNAAAVLRDYVRLRKLANAIKASVAKATLGTVVTPVVFKWDDSDKSWICYDAEEMCRLTTEVEESCINSMAELKRLLAEEGRRNEM